MRGAVSLFFAGFLSAVGSVPAQAGETLAASAVEVRPILVGAEIPDVTLVGVDGKPVELRAVINKQPTILIYYRGGW